jgi:hypothetical protein
MSRLYVGIPRIGQAVAKHNKAIVACAGGCCSRQEVDNCQNAEYGEIAVEWLHNGAPGFVDWFIPHGGCAIRAGRLCDCRPISTRSTPVILMKG